MADNLSISRGRVLEPELIKKLMEEEATKGLLKRKWPTYDDKPKIVKAIKGKKPSVVLGKTQFKIRYTDEDHVFLSPDNGYFAPCGWFSLRELENDLLEVKG